ncbi:coiled-coil domain-containing protein 130-like [Asterias rubens]|uniref:coiled-coil domain-containing protein 130-like n=1 Tax=Asterias rubens TaxID=7604 RepID=UPI00145595C5|nr:coiled-coil domain-containing protein 130-like [Asterias rubens]
MSDRKAVNRYYPPDFDPNKHGSINKYRNSHPLRERAKRLSEGILVIRFEMPYNIWCGGCGKHIGMGVRYNAEKTKVGNYYTTPIYRFRMKCHLCDHYFEMETNPMECDYSIVTGATRKNQKWDMAENEQVLTEDRETVKKLAADPMFKLEHGVDDSTKLEKVIPTLHELETTQTSWKNDFDQNRMLRQKFRMEKKEIKSADEKDQALLVKSSLDIALVPESEEDKKLASLLHYSAVESSDDVQKRKRAEITNRSIFSSKSAQLNSSSSSSPETPAMSPSLSKKSPSRSSTDIRKGIDLIEKLKSMKRVGKGFSDFGADVRRVSRKRVENEIGIAVVKRRKSQKEDSPIDDKCESETLVQGKEPSMELESGDSNHEVQQRMFIFEHVSPTLSEEQPGLEDRVLEGNSEESEERADLRDQVLSERSQQSSACQDFVRHPQNGTAQSVKNFKTINHGDMGVKSLVLCDYSSSDSDD